MKDIRHLGATPQTLLACAELHQPHSAANPASQQNRNQAGEDTDCSTTTGKDCTHPQAKGKATPRNTPAVKDMGSQGAANPRLTHQKRTIMTAKVTELSDLAQPSFKPSLLAEKAFNLGHLATEEIFNTRALAIQLRRHLVLKLAHLCICFLASFLNLCLKVLVS